MELKKFYITGGRLTTTGQGRDDRAVPPLISFGTSRVDAVGNSGITVWEAEEFESSPFFKEALNMDSIDAEEIINNPEEFTVGELVWASQTILDRYKKLQEMYEHSEWLRMRHSDTWNGAKRDR